MVTKYRKQIAARVDDKTYKKLCKHAKNQGLSLSEYLRAVITNVVTMLDPDTSPVSNLDQPGKVRSQNSIAAIELKKPPKVLAAKKVNPVTIKKSEPKITPSEPLDHEEEEKPKGLWQRFIDFLNTPILEIK